MERIGESEYYYDAESGGVYRKVKMTKQGYHIKDKYGKLKWIKLDTIKRCLVKMTTEGSQNDYSNNSQNDYAINSQNDLVKMTITKSQNDYSQNDYNSQYDYDKDSQYDYDQNDQEEIPLFLRPKVEVVIDPPDRTKETAQEAINRGCSVEDVRKEFPEAIIGNDGFVYTTENSGVNYAGEVLNF